VLFQIRAGTGARRLKAVIPLSARSGYQLTFRFAPIHVVLDENQDAQQQTSGDNTPNARIGRL
jgi:hypothetical protein